MPKPSLLILTDWFYPAYKAGGPVVSTTNLARALREQYHVKVLTSDTDHGDDKPYVDNPDQWVNVQGIEVYYASKQQRSFRSMIALLRNTPADVLYLNHLYSPKFVLLPLMLHCLGLLNMRVVLCPRGGLNPSAVNHKGYKKRPLIFILRLLGIHKRIVFHATNNLEAKYIAENFPGSRVAIADNFPLQTEANLLALEKRVGELKCAFVGRILDIKNLRFLLQVLKGMEGNISLSLIGPKEDANYWSACEEDIAALSDNIEISYLGSMPQQEVMHQLNRHHLFILPTRGENYGHAIVESWLAGRPVLISDQTPWRELNAKHLGWDLPLETAPWREALRSALSWSQADFDQYCTTAHEYSKELTDSEKLKEAYRGLFA